MGSNDRDAASARCTRWTIAAFGVLGAASAAAQDLGRTGYGETLLEEPAASVLASDLGLNLLDNGDFADEPLRSGDGKLARLPWWDFAGPAPSLAGDPARPEAAPWLRTPRGCMVRQPIADFEPWIDSLEVHGRVRGPGVVTLVDGRGGRAALRPTSAEAGPFRLALADFERELGRRPIPRFALELANDGSEEPAEWSGLAAWPHFPLVTREELRAEVLDQVAFVFDLWLGRCIDREGPRPTAFTCNLLDVNTGKPLLRGLAVNHPQPVYELMLEAEAAQPDPRWRAALARYLEDLLALGLNPQTGLPRQWDCARDQPLDDAPVEIAKCLGFLLDVHERGPAEWRERALAAALRIGETVLARGVLPDGAVAPMYVPRDGAPRTDVNALRRLDVPAELARLSHFSGDARFVAAARRAVAEFEFTNHWPGTWEKIDPGFDDSFGHYGARAMTMLEAFPRDPVFLRVVQSGWETYAPLWRDALRFGGSIAADQVRCWDLLQRYSMLEPAIAPELTGLLQFAARAHFKGEQYENGAWGDITFFQFDPKTGLAVGDIPGAPANLLWGLGILCRPELALGGGSAGALSRDDVRAMYAAVLRASVAAYRRPHGWLSVQRELQGANAGGGELRVARGLVEALTSL